MHGHSPVIAQQQQHAASIVDLLPATPGCRSRLLQCSVHPPLPLARFLAPPLMLATHTEHQSTLAAVVAVALLILLSTEQRQHTFQSVLQFDQVPCNLGPKLFCCRLKGVHYGVFGLGNKQYEHFNAVGKRMQTSMEALGATPICRRGDGDDDDSIDDDFEKWCTDLFAALDAQPALLGAAAAEGTGSDTLAAYRVELLPAGALVFGFDAAAVRQEAG